MNVLMTRSIAICDLVSCFQVWAGSVKFSLLLIEVITTQAKRYCFINTISKPLSNTNCWLATSHIMTLNSLISHSTFCLPNTAFEVYSHSPLSYTTCIWWGLLLWERKDLPHRLLQQHWQRYYNLWFTFLIKPDRFENYLHMYSL